MHEQNLEPLHKHASCESSKEIIIPRSDCNAIDHNNDSEWGNCSSQAMLHANEYSLKKCDNFRLHYFPTSCGGGALPKYVWPSQITHLRHLSFVNPLLANLNLVGKCWYKTNWVNTLSLQEVLDYPTIEMFNSLSALREARCSNIPVWCVTHVHHTNKVKWKNLMLNVKCWKERKEERMDKQIINKIN